MSLALNLRPGLLSASGKARRVSTGAAGVRTSPRPPRPSLPGMELGIEGTDGV